MIDFFKDLVTLVGGVIDTLVNTTSRIRAIEFDKTVFVEWLGYARYAMGDSLYMLFTSIILISIGVAMWTYLVKGITYLRSLLPW